MLLHKRMFPAWWWWSKITGMCVKRHQTLKESKGCIYFCLLFTIRVPYTSSMKHNGIQ